MSKENFYIDITGNVNQLYHIEKTGRCGNSFPRKFFTRYGISNRIVNNFCKKLGINVNVIKTTVAVYYTYTSNSADLMKQLVEKLNSFIILQKVAGEK